MEAKAAYYAEMIRRLLLQYGGIETRLVPAERLRTAQGFDEPSAPLEAAAAEDRDSAEIAEVSRTVERRELFGLTPAQMSDVFERDARRYDN